MNNGAMTVQFDMADTIDKVRKIEARIDEIKERHKNELKDYEEFAEQLRNGILKFLQDTGQQNAKTPMGTAYLARKESFKINDAQEFRRHVIGTESWELIEWRGNRTGLRAFEDKHKELPPGVEKSSVIECRVLAPEKPRMKVAAPQATEADTSTGLE